MKITELIFCVSVTSLDDKSGTGNIRWKVKMNGATGRNAVRIDRGLYVGRYVADNAIYPGRIHVRSENIYYAKRYEGYTAKVSTCYEALSIASSDDGSYIDWVYHSVHKPPPPYAIEAGHSPEGATLYMIRAYVPDHYKAQGGYFDYQRREAIIPSKDGDGVFVDEFEILVYVPADHANEGDTSATCLGGAEQSSHEVQASAPSYEECATSNPERSSNPSHAQGHMDKNKDMQDAIPSYEECMAGKLYDKKS